MTRPTPGRERRCDDCGVVCTAGTPAGPPTVGDDLVRRCRECERKDDRRRFHLRAAAPDLLAACEALLPLAESLIGPSTDSDGKTLPAVEAARAAILKAAGR